MNIGEFTTEQRFRAVDRKLFGDIDILTAAVITAPRVSFSIFIRKNRP